MEPAPRLPGHQAHLADGGYAGKFVTWAKTALRLTVQIVKRPDDLHTFKVLPRRWVDDQDAAEQARLGFPGHFSEVAATALARAVSFGRACHGNLDRMVGRFRDV